MKYLKSSLSMFLLSGVFILAAGLLDDSGYKATKFAFLAVSALSFFVGLLAYLNHGLAPISSNCSCYPKKQQSKS